MDTFWFVILYNPFVAPNQMEVNAWEESCMITGWMSSMSGLSDVGDHLYARYTDTERPPV